MAFYPACGSVDNLFAVIDLRINAPKIYSPKISSCVEGVSR